MSTIAVDVVSESDGTTISHVLLEDSQSQTITHNTSVPDGCAILRSDNTGFLPWDNPDNIVSAEVEEIVDRLKETVFLPILFVIGGPANVINMAVFYKQGLKDRVNLCLFALALADGLYLTSAMVIYGEQLRLQFVPEVRFGPIEIFMVNHNLVSLFGFGFVSQILSAIIASERCVCILSPLKFQTLLRTRTMAVIIIFVYVLVLGIYFIMAFKYNVGCVYDPVLGIAFNTPVIGEFYQANSQILDYLDSFVYGVGIPGFVITVVITTTIITTVKLRQIVTWRSETSSSISAREVALTKMLIGNSLLFIVCVTPVGVFRFVFIFFKEINAGRRHHNFFMTTLWMLDVISFINSTFNIFVYYSMGSRYRETFWALLSRKIKS